MVWEEWEAAVQARAANAFVMRADTENRISRASRATRRNARNAAIQWRADKCVPKDRVNNGRYFYYRYEQTSVSASFVP